MAGLLVSMIVITQPVRMVGVVPPEFRVNVNSSSCPPQTDVTSYEIASEEFVEQLGELRTLINTDLKDLEGKMQAAGAPWTPGTLPDWNGK